MFCCECKTYLTMCGVPVITNNNCRFSSRHAIDRDIHWSYSTAINFRKCDKTHRFNGWIPFAASNGFNFLFVPPRPRKYIGRISETFAAYRNIQTRNLTAFLRVKDKRTSLNRLTLPNSHKRVFIPLVHDTIALS